MHFLSSSLNNPHCPKLVGSFLISLTLKMLSILQKMLQMVIDVKNCDGFSVLKLNKDAFNLSEDASDGDEM